MPDNAPAAHPSVVRRLATPGAAALVELTAKFDDLQTVLRCCERLVTELAGGDGAAPDDLTVEAIWTTALLSYSRCFAVGAEGAELTEDDVSTTHDKADVLEWHRVLLQLREHYADPSSNPRERFTAGVAQDPSGAADGIAITSARQPLVDDLTVRQTGAIAFTLSRLVNDRISAQQQVVFQEVKDTPQGDLDTLPEIEVAEPEPEPQRRSSHN